MTSFSNRFKSENQNSSSVDFMRFSSLDQKTMERIATHQLLATYVFTFLEVTDHDNVAS